MSLEAILNSNPPICVFLRGTVDLTLASQANSVNLIQVVAAGLFERATRLVGSRPSDGKHRKQCCSTLPCKGLLYTIPELLLKSFRIAKETQNTHHFLPTDTLSNAGADVEFLRRVTTLENIIANFNHALRGGPRSSAPPSRATSPASRASSRSSSGSSAASVTINDRRTSVVARSIAQAAVIQLHNVLAEVEPATDASTRSYGLCLTAAREIASIIRELSIEEVDFLEPIIGVSRCGANIPLEFVY